MTAWVARLLGKGLAFEYPCPLEVQLSSTTVSMRTLLCLPTCIDAKGKSQEISGGSNFATSLSSHVHMST